METNETENENGNIDNLGSDSIVEASISVKKNSQDDGDVTIVINDGSDIEEIQEQELQEPQQAVIELSDMDDSPSSPVDASNVASQMLLESSDDVVSASLSEPGAESLKIGASVEVSDEASIEASVAASLEAAVAAAAGDDASAPESVVEVDVGIVDDLPVEAVMEGFDVIDSLMVLDEWQDEEALKEERKKAVTPDPDLKVKVVTPDPDLEERFLLTMPSISVIDTCLCKEEYVVAVSPITLSDLSDTKIVEFLSQNSCDDFHVSFVKSQKEADSFTGILAMNFCSASDAKRTEAALKEYRSGFEIKRKLFAYFEFERERMLWLRKEAPRRKNSSEKLILVKNMPSDATTEELRELFPDARNVILHPTLSNKSKDSTTNGISLVLCKSPEAVKEIVASYAINQPMIRQEKLKVLAYREPVANISKSLLRLKERRAILGHQVIVTKKIEKAKTDTSISASQYEKELKECKGVIERDNKTRKSLGLDCPNLAELKKMVGLKILSETQKEILLKDFRIISRSRRRSRERSGSRKRQHDDYKKSNDKSKNDKGSAKKSTTTSTGKTVKKASAAKADQSVSSSSATVAKECSPASKETEISESTVTTSSTHDVSSDKTSEPPAKVSRLDHQSDTASQLSEVVDQETKAQMNSEKPDPVELLLKLASILSQNMKQDNA